MIDKPQLQLTLMQKYLGKPLDRFLRQKAAIVTDNQRRLTIFPRQQSLNRIG